MNTSRPPSASSWAHSRRVWLLGWLAWLVLGLLSAAQGVALSAWFGRPVAWGPMILGRVADWGTCGLFTPAFFWMVERYPIRQPHWRLNVLRHLGASALFVPLKVALYYPVARALFPDSGRGYGVFLLANLFPDLLGYWAAVGVIHAIAYHHESRAKEVETARLDGALRAAELETLRAQLQPHFLFNTLQSISTLIHRDPAAADRMLTDLAELLRASLGHVTAQEVPLHDELGFLERYLAIMRVRFGDRLAIALDVPQDLHDATVPSLVLQPLVENAIRHGMADRTDHGHVTIRARRDGTTLRLEVEDDGPGMSRAAGAGGEGNGIGLANTRERLTRLYGAECALETLGGSGPSGLIARLTIPLRRGTTAPRA